MMTEPFLLNKNYLDKTQIELTEITKLSEKIKWQERFNKSYKKVSKASVEQLQIDAKYILIHIGNMEVGYLRITDIFRKGLFCLHEVYVKPAYRNQGIYYETLKKMINENNIIMIRIEKQLVFENEQFYSSLGFSSFVIINNHRYLILKTHRQTIINIAGEY
jgi:GNAT superfamily N-acetyltransferase